MNATPRFRRFPLPAALLAALLALSGCASNSGRLYAWGDYDDTLYAHYKNPQDHEKYLERLKQIVDEAEATGGGKVPPGLYADYGYALFEAGNNAEALSYFQKEKATWPESTVLMNKMIRNVEQQELIRKNASLKTEEPPAAEPKGAAK